MRMQKVPDFCILYDTRPQYTIYRYVGASEADPQPLIYVRARVYIYSIMYTEHQIAVYSRLKEFFLC